MWQFINDHEIVALIMFIAAVAGLTKIIRSIVERNKPRPYKCAECQEDLNQDYGE